MLCDSAIRFDCHVAQRALHIHILRDGAVELPVNVHAEQAFFLAIVLPLFAQSGKICRERLNRADDGREFNLIFQRFVRVILARDGDREVAKFKGSKDDFAAGICAKLGFFSARRTHGYCRIAIENARLAASALCHIEKKLRKLELCESAARQHRRIVGVPTLTIVAFKVAIFGVKHFAVVIIKERNHCGTPHAATDRRIAHRAHNVVRVNRAEETPLPRENARANKFKHLAQRFRSRCASAFGFERRARRAQKSQIKFYVAAIEPCFQAKAQRVRPTFRRIFDKVRRRRFAALTFHAREIFNVFAFDGISHAAAAHRNNQRFDKRVNAFNGHVGTVVNRNVVAPRRRARHREQTHRGHCAHFQNSAAKAFVRFARQTFARELVQKIYRTVNGFDPRFAASQIIIETRILVIELEFLQVGWKVFIRFIKGGAHRFGNGTFGAQFGMFRAIEDVTFCRFKFARRLQNHFNNVLNIFDGGLIIFCRDNISNLLCQIRNRNDGRAPETCKTTR